MLDTGDPSKIGTVVRDLYKTFAMPTQPAAAPAAAAWVDAARRGWDAMVNARVNAGGDEREGEEV
eukprot:2125853-Prymnesium_polylepis.1